jgi:CBS domain-containing protein
MKTVRQLLAAKQGGVVTVTTTTSVFDALGVMARHEIGAVLVMDGERLAGIMSERDYARKVILLGRSSQDIPVRDIMTDKVVCVGPDQTVQDCMELMTSKRIRHLPVLETGQLVGVLSIGDLVKALLSEQAQIIRQLEEYIHR